MKYIPVGKKEPSKEVLEAALAIKESIDRNPFDKAKVVQLMRETRKGRNGLLAAFRQVTSSSIKGYQVQRMMMACCELLEEGRLSKKQIAHKCHYRSQSNWVRAFKKSLGVTPSEWLAKNTQDRSA
jgi:AraC-like DNA-binding protein